MIVENEINLHGGDSQIKLIIDFSTKQIMVTDYSMPESGCET